MQTAKAGEIPVSTYFYPQSRQFAATYLQAATGYLDLYQPLFGPYPFDKFAVVENFFPTGYGYPSWTLLGSSVVALPFIVETSLGHEIAHCWWGNGVWVDYTRGNWSEGLTTYVADHLYKERQSPEEAREYRLKILRDYAALVTEENDFPLAEFISRSTAAEQAIGYGKAAMVFHMARSVSAIQPSGPACGRSQRRNFSSRPPGTTSPRPSARPATSIWIRSSANGCSGRARQGWN